MHFAESVFLSSGTGWVAANKELAAMISPTPRMDRTALVTDCLQLYRCVNASWIPQQRGGGFAAAGRPQIACFEWVAELAFLSIRAVGIGGKRPLMGLPPQQAVKSRTSTEDRRRIFDPMRVEPAGLHSARFNHRLG